MYINLSKGFVHFVVTTCCKVHHNISQLSSNLRVTPVIVMFYLLAILMITYYIHNENMYIRNDGRHDMFKSPIYHIDLM